MNSSKPFHPPKNLRLDPALYRQTGRVTFITIRAYLHTCPFKDELLSRMAIDALVGEQQLRSCRVITYCLMPDHIHYLISPTREGSSVLAFTDQYKGKTTNLAWKLGWSGKLWEPRYYDHLVRTDEDLAALIAYIMHNPVRRGLVKEPEVWPWSWSQFP